MMEPELDCLFCRIVAGEIPAEIVFSDEQVVAFADINPQAPTHVLVIPRLPMVTSWLTCLGPSAPSRPMRASRVGTGS